MLKLTTATGKSKKVQVESNLELKLGEGIFEKRVVVASITDEIVLVLNFIKENGIKLDLEAGLMYIKGSHY